LPEFQINFFPDLTQVNFFSPNISVFPALVHLLPGLIDAKECGLESRVEKSMDKNIAMTF
jgi:hypothetical protein